MKPMPCRLLAVLALGTVVQCSEGPTGITGSENLMVGRMAGVPYEGDASALVVRQAPGPPGVPDTVLIFAARPRNASFNVDEYFVARAALDGAPSPGTLEVEVEMTHLLGGDVKIGGYIGTGSLEITAFSAVDSVIRGTLHFTATNGDANRPGRYGATVTFSDGVFRARLGLSRRGL